MIYVVFFGCLLLLLQLNFWFLSRYDVCVIAVKRSLTLLTLILGKKINDKHMMESDVMGQYYVAGRTL